MMIKDFQLFEKLLLLVLGSQQHQCYHGVCLLRLA
jgi:hypothetical protein